MSMVQTEVSSVTPPGGQEPLVLSGAALEGTGSLRDVEARLLRRVEEQAALYDFTDRLYRAENAAAVYDAALETILRALRCDRASILLFDEAGAMRFAAWRGLSEGYRAAVDGHSPWTPADIDPQPIFYPDFEAADQPEPLKAVIGAEGIRALGFIPLSAQGPVIGKFMIYHDRPHEFAPDEIGLAVTIARQLGFSIQRLRAEEGRRIAEEQSRQSEARLLTMFNHAGAGITLLDADCTILRANAAYAAIVGRPLSELIGRSVLEISHPDDALAQKDAVAGVAHRGGSAAFEKRYIDKHGRIVWVRSTISHVGGGQVLAVAEDATGRIEAQEALRASEQRFRLMADAAPVMIWMSGPAEGATWFNRPWLDFTGRSMEQERGHGWAEGLHPDDHKPYFDAYHRAFDARQPFRTEYRLRRHDGAWRWLIENGLPLFSRAGNFTGYIGSCIDINDRRDAEERLRQTATQLALVTETAPVLIAHCDSDRRLKFVNRAYAERFRLTPEDCIGKPVAEIAGQEIAEAISSHIEAVLHGETVQFEATILFPLTGPRFMHISYTPEIAPGGAVVGWVAAITDITDRKAAEEALRESEERFRAIVETTPECVKLVAPDGTLLQMNSSGLSMIEADDAAAVTGRSVYEMIAPEYRETFRSFNEEVCQGARGQLEFEIVGLKGRRRHMETRAVPFRNPDGTMVQLAVTRDVSERKSAEAQRTLLINELNHRVKNTLATVQAIAAQTMRGVPAGAMLRQRFEARLIALSEAHSILTQENWEGAEISQIIALALQAHAGADRALIEGPPIRLSPKAAVAIAMGMHELATNAVKYGALSGQSGRVDVSWRIGGAERAEFALQWRESGGPAVSKPSVKGFGSRLIEHNLAHDLDGEARIDYRPEGLIYSITSPLAALRSVQGR